MCVLCQQETLKKKPTLVKIVVDPMPTQITEKHRKNSGNILKNLVYLLPIFLLKGLHSWPINKHGSLHVTDRMFNHGPGPMCASAHLGQGP